MPSLVAHAIIPATYKERNSWGIVPTVSLSRYAMGIIPVVVEMQCRYLHFKTSFGATVSSQHPSFVVS